MYPLAVLHLPHSADDIPSDVRRTVLVSAEPLVRERLLSTDWYMRGFRKFWPLNSGNSGRLC
jgi:hypothetical protein